MLVIGVFSTRPSHMIFEQASRLGMGSRCLLVVSKPADPPQQSDKMIFTLFFLLISLHLALADVCSMLALVNTERARAGRGPLVADTRLTRAAEIHSNAMLAARTMSHQLPGEADPFQRIRNQGAQFSTAGENVAAGQQGEAEVMQSWMASSGHAQNILGSQFNVFGYGRAGNYYTQKFAYVDNVQNACGSGNPQPGPQPTVPSAPPPPARVESSVPAAPTPVPISSPPPQDDGHHNPATPVNPSELVTVVTVVTVVPAPTPNHKVNFRLKKCRLVCWQRGGRVCRWKCQRTRNGKNQH